MKRILAVIAIAALAAGCTQIDTGNVGVESTFGQVKEGSLVPGVYQTVTKTVYEISAKEIPVSLVDLKPKTADNVTLQDLDVSVYYQIEGAQAAKVFARYAGDLTYDPKADAYVLGQGIVTRNAREAAYKAVAKQHSSDVHTKRETVAVDTKALLQAELDSSVGKGTFIITNVIVQNLVTDARLEEAIKQAAEVEFQTRRKNQQITLAKAEAERQRVEAEGVARANEIVARSLTPSLLKMREIEMTAQFAKAGTHTVLMGGNATPLVQVK